MTNIAGSKFVVLEGIDGSGKSTQLSMLVDRLAGLGVPSCATREPTDGLVGTLIRQHMKHRVHLNEETVALLFAADRLDHLLNPVDGIRQVLSQGMTVVCDRYYFSSYAYHSLHVPLEWVIAINSICAQVLRPDITIFIDASPTTCLKRLHDTRDSLERYENHSVLEKVREQYLKAFAALNNVERVVTVAGDDAPEMVAARVWEYVGSLFQDGRS